VIGGQRDVGLPDVTFLMHNDLNGAGDFRIAIAGRVANTRRRDVKVWTPPAIDPGRINPTKQ
jgi:hypothetical protein